MRLKMNKNVAAVIAASEARARGKSVIAENLLDTRQQARQTPLSVERNCRILGLDIALRKTGWGLVDVENGLMKVVDCGAIVNPPKMPVSECLRQLFSGVKTILEKYHPQVASIEGGFYCMNQRTAIILGTARGAAIGLLANSDMAIYEYAPRRVKQAVGGFGNASKGQVALLVAQALHIDVNNLSDDTTDALALALCHAQLMLTSGGLGLPEPL